MVRSPLPAMLACFVPHGSHGDKLPAVGGQRVLDDLELGVGVLLRETQISRPAAIGRSSSGVFGMNSRGLPFTDNEDAFLWASALMVASAIAVYLLMRRVGVFKLVGWGSRGRPARAGRQMRRRDLRLDHHDQVLIGAAAILRLPDAAVAPAPIDRWADADQACFMSAALPDQGKGRRATRRRNARSSECVERLDREVPAARGQLVDRERRLIEFASCDRHACRRPVHQRRADDQPKNRECRNREFPHSHSPFLTIGVVVDVTATGTIID